MKLYRLSELARNLGMSRSQIYRLLRAGQFPPAIRLSERVVAWREDDIRRWIDSRESKQKQKG
jgi:prophage regulatory protein